MKYRNFDLLLISILVLANVILVMADLQFPFLRVPFAILLTLLLPGYLLQEVLFSKAAPSWISRLALSLGISLGIIILGGLFLFVIFGSLSTVTWVLFLSFVILIESLIILGQRKTRDAPDVTLPVRGKGRKFSGSVLIPSLLISIALAITFSALQNARSVASEKLRTEIVQLWIVSDQANPENQVRLGIKTQTQEAQRFSLAVRQGDVIIQEWRDLNLQPNDQWEAVLALNSSTTGTEPIEAFLYVSDKPSAVFRHVVLWPDQGAENEAAK